MVHNEKTLIYCNLCIHVYHIISNHRDLIRNLIKSTHFKIHFLGISFLKSKVHFISVLKYSIFCVGWLLLSHSSSFLISNMADSFMARSKGKCQFKGILAILISGHPIQLPLFHILIFIVGFSNLSFNYRV